MWLQRRHTITISAVTIRAQKIAHIFSSIEAFDRKITTYTFSRKGFHSKVNDKDTDQLAQEGGVIGISRQGSGE
jgi:hypothetical protein